MTKSGSTSSTSTKQKSPSEKVLKQFFGFDNFREGQKEIVDSIISGRDTLAVRSTGSGKSICFQVPALYFPHLTLVISPLISLMSDQVQALQDKNIQATLINSSLSQQEITHRTGNLSKNQYKLLYLSPEKLNSPKFRQMLLKLPISFIAVDESHCISMWGHDFRPSYLDIPKFIEELPQRPVVAAFTATATPQIITDIHNSLRMQQPVMFKQSALRTNLTLRVLPCNNIGLKQLTLLKLLKRHYSETGVIYCSTRRSTTKLAGLINQLNFTQHLTDSQAIAYHGGLESSERERIQESFMSNHHKIICATNAFGMGVDKSDVRFVIHYQLPANIENYYQEVGRAGRDGKQSQCYLLLHDHDLMIQERMLENSSPDRKKVETKKLKQLIYVLTGGECLQQSIGEYFGDRPKHSCGECSSCLDFELFPDGLEQLFWQGVQQHSTLSKLPTQLQLLISLLQPHTPQEWKQLPGLGKGLIKQLVTTHDTIPPVISKNETL